MIRESEIERHLVKVVKKCGGDIRKVRWIGRRNCPDRRVMLSGFCFWAELKAPGEKLRKPQAREVRTMIENGESVAVFSTKDQIDEFFNSVYGYAP